MNARLKNVTIFFSFITYSNLKLNSKHVLNTIRCFENLNNLKKKIEFKDWWHLKLSTSRTVYSSKRSKQIRPHRDCVQTMLCSYLNTVVNTKCFIIVSLGFPLCSLSAEDHKAVTTDMCHKWGLYLRSAHKIMWWIQSLSCTQFLWS